MGHEELTCNVRQQHIGHETLEWDWEHQDGHGDGTWDGTQGADMECEAPGYRTQDTGMGQKTPGWDIRPWDGAQGDRMGHKVGHWDGMGGAGMGQELLGRDMRQTAGARRKQYRTTWRMGQEALGLDMRCQEGT